MTTDELMNLIANGIDPDSELSAEISRRLQIADHAVRLAQSLENSDAMGAMGREDVGAILQLSKETAS